MLGAVQASFCNEQPLTKRKVPTIALCLCLRPCLQLWRWPWSWSDDGGWVTGAAFGIVALAAVQVACGLSVGGDRSRQRP